MSHSLSEIRKANKQWFSLKNKRFFDDITYKILHDSEGNPYLVRSTYGWSDMFDGIKKISWHINAINPETLEIAHMFPLCYKTYDEVKNFIKSI